MAPATKPSARAAMKLPMFIGSPIPRPRDPSRQPVLPAEWAYPSTLRRSFRATRGAQIAVREQEGFKVMPLENRNVIEILTTDSDLGA